MSIEGIIGSTVAVVSMLAGLIVWAIKTVVAPLRVSLDNNTNVMERVIRKLDEHDDTLDDHGNRITRIETAHSHYHKGD